jgi:hypothetical protein
MFDEQEHRGAVKSRTHPACLVAEPIVVILDGLETELALEDAEALRDGLTAAVARVKESQSKLLGDGTNYNVVVLAKAGSGMSVPRSRLGDGQSLLQPF